MRLLIQSAPIALLPTPMPPLLASVMTPAQFEAMRQKLKDAGDTVASSAKQ